MLTIMNLFGRSPFAPFQTHMAKVDDCMAKLKELLEAMNAGDFDKVNALALEISQLEHEADITKNDIRKNLPRTLYLPVDRNNFLEILRLQDSIADAVEDVAIMTTLKNLEMPESLKRDFNSFLDKTYEAFAVAKKIIEELDDLLETSFGGNEAEKVNGLIESVAYKEHEIDLIQRELIKKIISLEGELSYSSFFLWMRIFERIGEISNISEKLAYRMRMTLDLK